jgi:LysR family transcriptional regulator, glycine cleavage system transcriptional activator
MARLTLPPLTAVRCFEAAARRQSFTRAAEELGMTQAAVSYQIKLLEERLGGRLFLRGSRGVTLTEAGWRLAPAVADAFAALRAAFAAYGQADEGVLNVSATNTFASNWLAPRLGAFQLAHPKIAVRLEVSGRLVDFTREEVDIGIRTGAGQWPGLTAHRLMRDEYTPMLSPRLLAKVGKLKRPADLLKLSLIDPTDPWWIDWFAAAGVDAPDLSRRTEMRVGAQNLAAQGALAGHGVAILTPAFYSTELAEGRLVQPFPLIQNANHSYWLVYLQSRRGTPKIRAFRDWILAAVTSE